MNDKPTHLDLFSGIGGFALAAGWAGFETIGFSEIDSYASAVLRKHWPGVPNYGDVRTVPTVRCDLITGGFPCQPFSCAGKRRGAEDDRFLWPAMLDVIKRCGPAWVLGENVAGLIDMELDRCFADLEGAGYEVQPLVIPACAVDARHRRDRVWIVANSKSHRRKQTELRGQEPPRTTDASENVSNSHFINGHGTGHGAGALPQQPTATILPSSLADAGGDGCGGILREARLGPDGAQQRTDVDGKGSGKGRHGPTRETLADADYSQATRQRKDSGALSAIAKTNGPIQSSGIMANTERESERAGLCAGESGEERCGRSGDSGGAFCQWPVEPNVGRVANGVSHRVDRLKGLGNAIVPQVAYEILKVIYKELSYAS